MPVSLNDELTNLGLDLNDVNSVFFTTNKLTMWINQAQLNIARRAECLLETSIIPLPSGQYMITAPADVIRINMVTFSPNDPTQIYPLTFKARGEMNSIWYVNQQTPGSYPLFYTTWAHPPTIICQVFPIPAQPGVLQFWYYRLPKDVVNTTDFLDIPEGYEEALRAFVRYNARRNAGDPSWQDDMAMYEALLSNLITNSRNWTDESSQFAQGGSMVPGWLYGGWGS